MKNNKRFLQSSIIIVGIFVSSILLMAFSFILYKESKKNSDRGIYAGITVFINEKQQDFHSNTYSFTDPCALIDFYDESQNFTIFINEKNQNIVRIQNQVVTWRSYFEILNVQYSYDPLPVMYLNNRNTPNLLDMPIQKYDSAVIIFGEANDVELLRNQYVSKEELRNAEKDFQSCSEK